MKELLVHFVSFSLCPLFLPMKGIQIMKNYIESLNRDHFLMVLDFPGIAQKVVLGTLLKAQAISPWNLLGSVLPSPCYIKYTIHEIIMAGCLGFEVPCHPHADGISIYFSFSSKSEKTFNSKLASEVHKGLNENEETCSIHIGTNVFLVSQKHIME